MQKEPIVGYDPESCAKVYKRVKTPLSQAQGPIIGPSECDPPRL